MQSLKRGREATFSLYHPAHSGVCLGMPAHPRKKPKRSFNPLLAVLVSGGVLLVLLVVGLLVAKSMVNGWLRGEGFRDWLAKEAAGVLRSEIELSTLEWKGSEVYAERFKATGREEAGFSVLSLDGVRARAGGIVRRAVRVPEVTVNRLELSFSPERKSGPEANPTERGGSHGTSGAALPGWLKNYLPDRVEIDEIAVATTRISVKKAEGEVFLLSGARAVLAPDFGTGFWTIDGQGGTIRLPGQPEIALKDLGLRWKERDLFIDRCALGIFKEGHVDGKGEIGFEDPGRFDLELEISAIDIDELVQGEWRDRLAGTVHGPVRITGAPGALVYEGTMNVSDGRIEAMPVLKRIAQYTRSERFERLVLNQAKVDFKREGDRLELRNLAVQSDGLVRVEGEADLVGDQLTGAFQVGVTPGTMRWIPGAERLVFTVERDGFLWAPMKLAGTLAEPREDLSARLIAAAGEAVISDLPAGVLDAAQGLLKPGGEPGEEKSATGDLIDQGKKALELLTPLLKVP